MFADPFTSIGFGRRRRGPGSRRAQRCLIRRLLPGPRHLGKSKRTLSPTHMGPASGAGNASHERCPDDSHHSRAPSGTELVEHCMFRFELAPRAWKPASVRQVEWLARDMAPVGSPPPIAEQRRTVRLNPLAFPCHSHAASRRRSSDRCSDIAATYRCPNASPTAFRYLMSSVAYLRRLLPQVAFEHM